jgi:hypothetical protein
MVAAATLASAAVLSPGTPAGAAVTPAAGIQLKAAHSKMCLNVDHDRKTNGVPIIQYTCGDAYPNDKWLVRPVGATGVYQIMSTSSQRCLHVSGAGTTDNTPIIQYGCVDTAEQNLWRFVPVAGRPTFRIISVDSGKCLNVSKASLQVNTPLIIYRCTETALNDQFYFPPAALPDPQPLATTPDSPIVGAQGGPAVSGLPGAMVYSWTDDDGQLWHGYHEDPIDPSTLQWSLVPGTQHFAGPPQIAVRADGRVQTAVRNTADGDLWLSTQTGVGTAEFGAAQDVGGAGAQQPALGTLPNGNVVAFAVVNGAMWHLPQDGRNAPYAAWRLIGGSNLTGSPAVVPTREGVRLFALDTGGAVQTALYSYGEASDWTSLGPKQFTGQITATVLPGYRSRVVARTADGLIFTKVQKYDETFEADWFQLGDFVAAGPPAAVLDPWSGAVAIVARGADDRVYWVGEKVDEVDVFGSWALAHPRTVHSDPTVLTYAGPGGPTWAYLAIGEGDVPLLFRRERNGSTSGGAARSTPAAVPSFAEQVLPRPPLE